MTLRNPTATPKCASNAGKLPWLALGLVLACVAVVGYKLTHSGSVPPVDTLPAQTCNPASERCTAPLPGGGAVAFTVTPSPILPLRPLQLEVSLTGYPVDRVEVDFTGVSMDMGTLHSTLTGSGRQFGGEAMLPVCTTGAMTWSATLRLSTRSGELAVPFHFEVSAR